jgi:hypothetical protein
MTMAELVTNGTAYPPQPGQNAVLTQVVDHLDLRDLLLERGTSGLRRAGGYVAEEWDRTIGTGMQAARVYRQMRDTSSTIAACLFAVEMLLRQVPWHLQPADDTEEAQHYADLVDGMLFEDLQLPWSLLLAEILSFLTYGYAYLEMVFKRRLGPNPPPRPDGSRPLPSAFDDGLIGLGRLAPRAQETVLRWEFSPEGILLGAHQLDPWSGKHAYIPYEKALHFVPTSYKENPEGRSILRSCHREYFLATNLQNVEAIAAERDLTGLPVFGTPPQWWAATATPEEQAQLAAIKRIGRNIRADEQACLVFPLIYDTAGNQLLTFQLAASAGTKAIQIGPIVERYELRMTQSMLCDLLFLGHESVGSFELDSSKTTTLAMSLAGYLQVICDEFNRHALPTVWRLNAFPDALRPTLAHGDVESVDLKELSQFITSYGRAFNLTDLENHIRQMAGFPERLDAETNPLPPSITGPVSPLPGEQYGMP